MFSKIQSGLPYLSPESLSEASEWVAFPLSIQSRAKSYKQALVASKQVIAEFEQSLTKVEKPSYKMTPADSEELPSDLKIAVQFIQINNEPCAQLYYTAQFVFDENLPFWEKMENVTATLDLISAFCDNYKNDKQTTLLIGDKFIGK